MQFHRLINHVTRQILLCEIMLIEVQSWLKFRRGISPDDFPMECTANHKTLYRAYYWTVHSRYRPAFFNQALPQQSYILAISTVVFAYNNLSGLRNYTFSVHKRLVDRHPYHEGRIYCPNSQEGNIRNFVSLTGSINIVNVTRVCNIIFGDYKFNNLFFPEFNQTYYYTL